MNAKSAKSSRINVSSRCTQRFANGKCCTNFAAPGSVLCSSHAKLAENRQEAADLSATLTSGLDKFKSPAVINDFLSRLLLLLAQDRVSHRRVAGLRQALCDRRISNEGYDDKLQADRGAGRGAGYYVEVFPSGECCHVVTPGYIRPLYCSSLTFSIQSAVLPSSCS
jgi:hypothetical protein